MGLVQHRHLRVHPVRRRAPENGRAHLESEASEDGQVGGQPGGADASSGQYSRQVELRE